MKAKFFFNFFFGIITRISYSFLYLLPLTIFVYFSFIKKIYKIESNAEGFFLGGFLALDFSLDPCIGS